MIFAIYEGRVEFSLCIDDNALSSVLSGVRANNQALLPRPPTS